MKSPIIILITSQQCGHCVHFRGDGTPRENQEWSLETIRRYLTGSSLRIKNPEMQAASLINIHLSTMQVDTDNIIEVDEYVINDNNGKIYRNSFIRHGDDIEYRVEIEGKYSKSGSTQLQNHFKEHNNNFIQYQANFIPMKIKKLIAFFPAWIFVRLDDWTMSILNDAPLNGRVVSCTVKQLRNHEYEVEMGDPEDPEDVLKTLQ
jgi:hypothetical protein